MAEQENPLIKALPPASDYLTYLTIIEYNLSVENLPILHQVLQDEALTTNIGWDLVHLLLPFLPESHDCLRDIARLGNPREVILKVTESLRMIEYQDQGSESDEQPPEAGAAQTPLNADKSTFPLKTAPVTNALEKTISSQARELPTPLPAATEQFITLLPILNTLHGRIKTKSPSRFLSTTLQAVLASFSNSVNHREEMILAIVRFVRALAGTKRPALPARQSSSNMLKSAGTNSSENKPLGQDPEASAESNMSAEEKAMQTKLLQSFVTHVLEEYMLNLDSGNEDIPGMAWSSRIMEKTHPGRIIPETTTFRERFAREERLHRRIDAVGQLATCARDLGVEDEDLIIAATTADQVSSHGGMHVEDEPPAKAEDIPLSRLGSLMLYAARRISDTLYASSVFKPRESFTIFPNHQDILTHCLSNPQQGTGTLGTEPEALIDAVLALGLLTLEDDQIGEPASDEQFNEYLQVAALLSSNCPSGNLRGHAHYLVSTVLRSQPDDAVRLAFIRDTLEHCPFENLKVSAVGWIKGETIEANPPTPMPGHSHPHTDDQEKSSIFATPIALDSVATFLFPPLRADLVTAPVYDAWLTFRTNLSFYLASLNFAYLLLCAQHLHHPLSIHDLWTSTDIAGSFMQPLRDASARFKRGLETGGEIADEKNAVTLAELNVLDESLDRVNAAVKFLNE